jgi:hypothetical protein
MSNFAAQTLRRTNDTLSRSAIATEQTNPARLSYPAELSPLTEARSYRQTYLPHNGQI